MAEGDLETNETETPEDGGFKKVGMGGSNYRLSDNTAFAANSAKKSNSIWIIVVVIIILILAGGGFFFRHQIKSLFSPSTTNPTPTPTAVTENPTPTPVALVKSDWSLEVVNGSGAGGLAKKIADKITALGYNVIKVGNADKSDYAQSEILVKKELLDKVDLVIADLKDVIKIASVGGELKDSTASARIIIGKDSVPTP